MLLVLGVVFSTAWNYAAGDVFRWEYNARLISVIDPAGDFPDLKLGDPVTGFVQFDSSVDFFEEGEYFAGLTRFQALSLEAMNPRSNESFTPPPAFQDPPLWESFDLSDIGVPFPGPEFSIFQGFEGLEDPFDPFSGPFAFFEGNNPLPNDGVPVEIEFDDMVIGYESGGEAAFAAAIFSMIPVELPFGDLDADLRVDQLDIDALTLAVGIENPNKLYDLNEDGVVDNGDRDYWIGEIAATQPGDANLDGVVDFEDFLVVSGSFGAIGGWADGNFDLEATIDFADFLLLSANFGSGPTIAAVPEPNGIVPLAIGSMLILFASRMSSRELRPNENCCDYCVR